MENSMKSNKNYLIAASNEGGYSSKQQPRKAKS